MYPLLESLKLKNGQIQNLEFHQDRLNRTMEELFPQANKIDIQREISVPENCSTGIFKVRVLYRQFIEKIEIEPYIFRTINSLKVVHHESIDYHLKYSDRQILQELFACRGDCDDIIIVKEGFVTDSFAANLLFFDGINWFTPTTPLLRGTKRQYLLEQRIISEKKIREKDIKSFQKVGLVNAMVDFEEMPVIATEQIWF
jgi:4-amino-4-deoxychorismate lyase